MYKLREINKLDIPLINKWRNDNELINFLGAPFRYINLDVDYNWFDNYMKNRTNTVRCAVTEKTNEDIILGMVSITNIDSINQSGIFHIMIGNDENRGKGIGSFATNEILKHVFHNLNLNRIELNVLESNQRAINLYEKIGFKNEGTKRKAVFKNGEYIDLRLMGILKEDYYNKQQ